MDCKRVRLILEAGGQDRCSARRREAEVKEEKEEEEEEEEEEKEEGAAAAVARRWGEEEGEEDGRNWNASARTASRASRHRLTSNRMPLGVAPPAQRRCGRSIESLVRCSVHVRRKTKWIGVRMVVSQWTHQGKARFTDFLYAYHTVGVCV